MTDIREKWDSVHRCLADMDLVNADIPVLWFAAYALMVCLSSKSMGLLENDINKNDKIIFNSDRIISKTSSEFGIFAKFDWKWRFSNAFESNSCILLHLL